MDMKKLPNSKTLLTMALLSFMMMLLSGCGTPSVIYAGNIRDTTATPQGVAQVSTAAGTAVSDMPGMPMSTTAPVTMLAAGGKAIPTYDESFVVAWILFGTPTPSGQQISAAPPNATAQAVAVQPSRSPAPATTQASQPTLAPTATRVVTTATSVSSGSSSSASSGNAANGKVIFNGLGGCSACHDVVYGGVVVGPSLKGIAARAGTRKPGVAAVDYLHESIVKPNAYVVQGFAASTMPQNMAQTLTEKQIDDVIAYLLTLK